MHVRMLVDVLPAGNTCGYFSTTAERPAYGCYPEVRDLDNLGHSFDFLQELGQAGSFRNAQLRGNRPACPGRPPSRRRRAGAPMLDWSVGGDAR
jgi:hypothetical protein